MVARVSAQAAGAIQPRSEFRTSFTSPAGLGATNIMTGRIVGVDTKNYTVDVVSQFDQMRMFDIQVSSPYLHSSRGEGATFMPEIGAKCAVCWPGDSAPPFVLTFVMPHETITMSGSDEAPGGTSSRGSSNQALTSASFAGGRPQSKLGDIFLRGRDGNFMILHRGGVLQIGSTELAQRVYVPLGNLVMDYAENYAMHNSGGSVKWGIQEGEGESNLPAEYVQTFRVFANEQYADLRVAVGRVHNPVPEKDRDAITDEGATEVGKSEPIVYELTLAKGGFKAEDGSPNQNAGSQVKLRFFFDRVGNTFMRLDGNVGILCKKKLRVRVKGALEVFADSSFSMTVNGDGKVTASGTLEIVGGTVKVNGGSQPVAHVGSQVSVTLPPTLLMAAPGPPGYMPIPPGMNTAIGSVTSGRSNFLV